MQTFLPYADYTSTAKTLDRQRLGKQRVEAYQIVLTNIKRQQGNDKGAWFNHPIVKMWVGYEYELCEYGKVICSEWKARGYKDNLMAKFIELQAQFLNTGRPDWLGKPEFHISHQSKLIQKLPSHYEPQFPNTPKDLDYVWFIG
jgi:hypothetical protein